MLKYIITSEKTLRVNVMIYFRDRSLIMGQWAPRRKIRGGIEKIFNKEGGTPKNSHKTVTTRSGRVASRVSTVILH